MCMGRTALCVLCCVAVLAVTVPSTQAGVSVGGSSLIQTLDYSDTFTCYDYGGLADREDAGPAWPGHTDYPVDGLVGQGLIVEDSYGNPARWWGDYKWTFATDGTALPGNTAYPGSSGAGSSTGMTQTGGVYGEWGIEYGVRDRFVVQFDGVQTEDRVSILTSEVRDSLWHPTTIGIFIRLAGSMTGLGLPEISVFNANVGEVDTGLFSPVFYAAEWHNYAALFDVPEREITLYVDEAEIGVIDLDTIGGGVFASIPLSNSTVNVSYSQSGTSGDRFWCDNFQVGSPDPASPPGMPGDANRDGVVDETDAQRLAAYWGAGSATWEMGDFNGDMVVDLADASILAGNWGSTSESVTVPEPGVFVLILAGLGLCLFRKR